MLTNIGNRKRKVNISNLSNEQVDGLSAQIGKELAKIIDRANIECTEILSSYGFQTIIVQKYTKETEEEKEIVKMSHNVVEKLRADIRLKIINIMERMEKECNELVNIYGVIAQMSYDIVPSYASVKK